MSRLAEAVGALLEGPLDWVEYRFVQRDFIIVTADGVSCTMTPCEAAEMATDAHRDCLAYTFAPTRMTYRQFDEIGPRLLRRSG